jgi:hypothetical protein
MLKFPEGVKIYFEWSQNLSKKMYNDDLEDVGTNEYYIRITDTTFAKVDIMSSTSVKVVDESCYLNGLKINGKINLYGSPVGEHEIM